MDRIVSFGEALVDMLSSRLDGQSGDSTETFSKFPGGAPANVAAAVGKLGGASFFVGKIGADSFGAFMLNALSAAKANTDYVVQSSAGKTALAFVSLDSEGERSFEFYRNQTADLLFAADDFQDECFSEPGIFHFCSNTLTDSDIRQATLQGIEKARAAHFIISFDVNLRTNLWADNDPYIAIKECAGKAHILKMCTQELKFLARQSSETEVIHALLEAGVKIILVTDGAQTLRYYTPEHSGAIEPQAVSVVDSTAAGDSFVGGFLYALANKEVTKTGLPTQVSRIAELEAMLTFASSCGAYTAAHKGAFTALPSQEQLETFNKGELGLA